MPFTVLLESACCWHTHTSKLPTAKIRRPSFSSFVERAQGLVLIQAASTSPFWKNKLTRWQKKNKKQLQKKKPHRGTNPQNSAGVTSYHFPAGGQEDCTDESLSAAGSWGGWVGKRGGGGVVLHAARLSPPPPPPSQWLRKAKPHLLKDFLPNFSPIEISSEMDMRP